LDNEIRRAASFAEVFRACEAIGSHKGFVMTSSFGKFFTCWVLVFTATSSESFGQAWADLTMTVKWDGDIPAPRAVNIAGVNLEKEDLVVDPTTHGIANLIFMVDTRRTPLEHNQIHPALRAPSTEKPVLECSNLSYSPHVMLVRSGQTLIVKNSDRVRSNFNFRWFENPPTNLTLDAGRQKEIQIQEKERTPTKIENDIHPWMSAYLIVADHPYVGISSAEGVIKIDKLPAGVELRFQLWHEHQIKLIEKISLNDRPVTWSKGSVRLTLKEGNNDLGTMLIKPARFRN
jgi:hypothetical protein